MQIDNSEYTEDALISRLLKRVPTPDEEGFKPGDDAAILEIGNSRTLACADVLVEGVHFDFAVSTPGDVGWKALAVNLSDIAAMGGKPLNALVVLGIALDERGYLIAEELYEGLGECAQAFGVAVSGGDLTSSQRTFISVTVIGSLHSSGDILLRSGAQTGDLICVTGVLGEAALALKYRDLLYREHLWVQRLCRPVPRLREGNAILAAGGTSAIDISDGLLLDLTRLTIASEKAAYVDPERVPRPMPFDWPVPEAPHELDEQRVRAALGGGDDYELCFTIAPDRLSALESTWPEDGAKFTVIGEIKDGEGVAGPGGLLPPRGWDHLRQEQENLRAL